MRATLIALSLLVGACSSVPGEQEGRDALDEHLANKAGGAPYSIAGFEKTNGQELEVSGSPAYKLFFSADVRFPEGLYPICLNLDQIANGMKQFQTGLQCSQRFSPFSDDPLKALPVGATTKLTGEITLSQSENGWLTKNVKLTSSSPI
ncbi:hypothetical protein J3454_06615 [Erythrobacter sp. NFXS35]|uniref:hypothetical protein n=1 Tax=Erythrobacter sp. NFXS35 TaxID=2818436 RepID=UPI0032DF0754